MQANVEAAELWRAVATQWRYAGMGFPAGLDYTAMYQVARTLEIEIDTAMLNKIRALECEYIRKNSKK